MCPEPCRSCTLSLSSVAVLGLPEGCGRSRLPGSPRRFPLSALPQSRPVHRRLCPSLHAELGEQARNIVLDGLLCEEQPFPNLSIGASFSDEIEDLAFPSSQAAGHRVRLNRMPQPIEQLLRDCRIQQRPPRRDLPDALDEVVSTNLLEQVARRAGHHRSEERIIVVVGSQNQTPDVFIR